MGDMLSKLSREVQIVLGGTVLYLLFSFFDWQQVSAFGITAGRSEWNGIGIVAGLAAVAVLGWEATRIVRPEVALKTVKPAALSALLVAALFVFTVITFLSHNEARHWPSWLGLILSVVIGLAAGARARDEGVQLPAGRPHTPASR